MTLNMSWAANPPAEQVVSYDVRLFRNGSLINSATVATPGWSVDNPPAGLFTFDVRANNIAGSSAYASPASGPPAPSVPTGLQITSS
jgi:hypothetical protein